MTEASRSLGVVETGVFQPEEFGLFNGNYLLGFALGMTEPRGYFVQWPRKGCDSEDMRGRHA